jgi:hypothetical protein
MLENSVDSLNTTTGETISFLQEKAAEATKQKEEKQRGKKT